MARYYPVSPHFWTDPKARRWDDATRLLAAYTLTCEHRNLEGLYRLPLTYIAADLGWGGGKVKRVLDRLIEDGFLMYDADAEVVFVCKSLKYQAPKNERQVKGAVNVLMEVPPNRLHEAFMEAVQSYAPALAEALSNGYRKP
jgi:hypothetical protein